MQTVTLEVDNVQHNVEVLSVQRLDEQRSAIQIHCSASLDRGRSCNIRTLEGGELHCVISNYVRVKDIYVIELRCLEDAQFLMARSGSE